MRRVSNPIGVVFRGGFFFFLRAALVLFRLVNLLRIVFAPGVRVYLGVCCSLKTGLLLFRFPLFLPVRVLEVLLDSRGGHFDYRSFDGYSMPALSLLWYFLGVRVPVFLIPPLLKLKIGSDRQRYLTGEYGNSSPFNYPPREIRGTSGSLDPVAKVTAAPLVGCCMFWFFLILRVMYARALIVYYVETSGDRYGPPLQLIQSIY